MVLILGITGLALLVVLASAMLPLHLTLAVDVPFWGGTVLRTPETLVIMIVVAALCGALMGGFAIRHARLDRGPWPARMRMPRMLIWLGIVAAGAVLMGGLLGQTSLTGSVLAAVFGYCAADAGLKAAKMLETQGLGVQTHWGGLGGGLGGWRLSQPAALLLLSAGFAFAAIVALSVSKPERAPDVPAKPAVATPAGH